MRQIFKRILSTAAAGIMLFGTAFGSTEVFAYSELPVNSANYDIDSEVTNFVGGKLTVGTDEIGSGLTVTYHVYSIMSEGFASCKVSLEYPSGSGFSFGDASCGSTFSGMSPEFSRNDSSRQIVLSLSSAKNCTVTSGTPELMRVEVKIPAGTKADTYNMRVRVQQFLDSSKNPLSYYPSSGSITVTGDSPVVKTNTVTFAANGGSGSMSAATVDTGSKYVLPACGFTAPAGKTFAGWQVGGVTYQPGTGITVSADTTVTAVWAQVIRTVTFAANGGSGNMNLVTVNDGGKLTLPECGFTAPAGKTFAGWQIGTETYQPGSSVTVSSDITVSAIWAQNTKTVVFDANGGSGSMNSVSVAAGGTLTLPECTFTAPAGKSFAGWQIGWKTYEPGSTVTVTEDMTVTAFWAQNMHTVTYSANGGGGSMSSISVSKGGTYVLPACGFTAPAGYVFSGWRVSGVLRQPGESLTVTNDLTVIAQWTGESCTVVYSANDGSGRLLRVNAQNGQQLTLPENQFSPVNGFSFAGWLLRGETYQPGSVITLTGDTTILASWNLSYLRGDANSNGEIGADDAQKALKAYVNTLAGKDTGMSAVERLAADVDGDGQITATDAQVILKYYVNTLAGKNVTWEQLLPKK